jgi:hypothetical protein
MNTVRQIKKLVTGHPTVDGAGVHLVRVLARDDVEDFDPFLMLDAFDSTNPSDYIKGFPWHPHRGSRPSHTSSAGWWRMATAWATRAKFGTVSASG